MEEHDLQQSLNKWLTSSIEQELYSRFRWNADSSDKIHLDISFIEDKGWIIYRYTSTSMNTVVDKADMLLINIHNGVIRQLQHVLPLSEAETLIESSEGRSLGKVRALENFHTAYGENLLIAGVYVQIPENYDNNIAYGEGILRNVGVPSFLPYSVVEGERIVLGNKTSKEIWVLSLIPEGCVEVLSWNISNLRQPQWRVADQNKWSIPTMPTSSMMKLSSLIYSDVSFSSLNKGENLDKHVYEDFAALMWSEVSYSISQEDYRWNRMKHLDRMLNSADKFLGQYF